MEVTENEERVNFFGDFEDSRRQSCFPNQETMKEKQINSVHDKMYISRLNLYRMVPKLMPETLNCVPIERRQLVDQDKDLV